MYYKNQIYLCIIRLTVTHPHVDSEGEEEHED
jgi:hypothetical protein